MMIEVKKKGDGIFEICPEGNIDYATAPELDETIAEIAVKARQLVIDLKEVPFVASAGLRVLLNADDLMCEKDGSIIVNANDYIKNIFEMTGFDEELTIQ